MRRDSTLKRGRVVTILLAAAVGYLLGNWQAVTLRSANPSPALSPAENVALRFPEARADAAVADAAPDIPTNATSAMMVGGAQLALLSPEPMVRQIVSRPPPQAAVQIASAEQNASLPVPEIMPAHRPMPLALRAEPKSPADSAVRRANRPGFVLNDAQIASIKGRLHLTPDQERMWPSVEAALRSIAYAKARDARRRDAVAVVASLDPDSAEVQDLKSAAVPLIMSFSDEQKNEVRNLAHVMGLDRLASEF